MAITAQTLELTRRLRATLDRRLDAQTYDLVSAWVDAWDEVAPDLNEALLEQLVAGERITRGQLLRSKRLANALGAVADNLEELAQQAGVRITGDLRAVIDTAGGAQASVIDSQLPPNSDLVALDAWSRVDDRQIDAIVRRSTQQITSTLRPLSAETYDVVRRELIRGVAAGSNPRVTARRMVARAERRFNGRLGLTRALVISRTETLDAHRAAEKAGRLAQADVLRGWEWVSTLDRRTCRSCWAQHGSVHPLEEDGPLDHQQGRCVGVPVTRPWADLGITGVKEPASVLPDAAEVFTGLDPDEQRAVLGQRGYEAWASGAWPMDSWSQRRTTDGWRDSYVAAPQPPSGGRVSVAA